MKTTNTIQEKFLYDIWKNQSFNKELITNAGQKIIVYDPGVENKDSAGPDFINARVKIGEITYQGDIEIDTSHYDWKNHGHNLNNRFNKVILHAILKDDCKNYYVLSRDGRKIQAICFSQFVDNGISSAIQKSISSSQDEKHLIHCFEVTDSVPQEILLEQLRKMGLERFKKKCEKMVNRLRELIHANDLEICEPNEHYKIPEDLYNKEIMIQDLNVLEIWEQLLYESLFEALGYSQNKSIMLKLAQSADLKFLKTFRNDDNFLGKVEATLFKIGGLLPEKDNFNSEDSPEYVRNLIENWISIGDSYHGKYFSEENWSYFKLRPQNFPAIRIAGGIKMIDSIVNHDLIKVIQKKFCEIRKPSILLSSVRALFIVKSEGYWSKHYVFDKGNKIFIKYFVGTGRADEIMINVILPFMYIYFDLFGRKNLAQKTLETFGSMEMGDENSLVKEISDALNLDNHWKNSLVYQGMIELFRTYCSRGRCNDCGIGAEVFDFKESVTP